MQGPDPEKTRRARVSSSAPDAANPLPDLAPPSREHDPVAERARRESLRAERAEQQVRFLRALHRDLALDRRIVVVRRHLMALPGVGGGWLALFDESAEAARLYTSNTPGGPLDARAIPLARADRPTTMLEVLRAEREPLLVADYPAACRERRLRPLWPEGEQHARAWLGLPLRAGDRPIGVLAVWSATGALAADIVALIRDLGESIAAALDQAQRHATSELRWREEALFGAIAQDLAAHLDSEAIIRQIGQRARLLLGGTCRIALHDPRAGRLAIREFDDASDQPVTYDLPPDDGLAWRVWRTGRAHIAPSPPGEAEAAPGPPRRGFGAALGVPITLDTACLGALLLGSAAGREFTGRDEAILARLATQIALAVRNTRALAAERERAARAEALREIGRDLSANLDLARLFDSLRRHLMQLAGLDNCWVGQVAEGQGAYLSLWVEGGERRPEAEGPLPLPLPPSMFREVVEAGHSILTDNYGEECRRRGLPTAGFQADRPNRAWLGLPLRSRGRTIGALAVWRWDAPIPAEVVGILETLVGQIATALENARLYEEAERQRREEAAFGAIARDLATSLDRPTTLQRISDHAHRLLGANGARLIEADAATGDLLIVAGSETLGSVPVGERVDGEAGLLGEVWRTGRPFMTSRYVEDRRFRHLPDLDQRAREHGWGAVLAVPIRHGEQQLGILWVHTDGQRTFTAQDEATLLRLANLAAVAIHNSRLYAEARRLASGDPLTGLLNHRSFQERLDQEFSRATRYQRSLAVVMLDLDNFKHYNDTYGHPAGDRILQATATILREETREADIIARYGGDEFCLILPETTRDGASTLIERVRDRCARIDLRLRPIRPQTQQGPRHPPLRISAGVAIYPHDTKSRHELVSRADVALYTQKRGDGMR